MLAAGCSAGSCVMGRPGAVTEAVLAAAQARNTRVARAGREHGQPELDDQAIKGISWMEH